MLPIVPNFSAVKILGFDLDQTLYPKSPDIDRAIQTYLYLKITEHLGVDMATAEARFREQYQDGKGLSGSRSMAALGIPLDLAQQYVQEALERADISPFLARNEETIALLQKLKKQFLHIDLITGSNFSNALMKLEKLGINPDIFTHIITADDASKSDGAAYTLWLSHYAPLAPESFLYIGDRPSSDYEVPRTLGIASILVNRAASDEFDCLQLPTLHKLSHHLFPNPEGK